MLNPHSKNKPDFDRLQPNRVTKKNLDRRWNWKNRCFIKLYLYFCLTLCLGNKRYISFFFFIFCSRGLYVYRHWQSQCLQTASASATHKDWQLFTCTSCVSHVQIQWGTSCLSLTTCLQRKRLLQAKQPCEYLIAPLLTYASFIWVHTHQCPH